MAGDALFNLVTSLSNGDDLVEDSSYGRAITLAAAASLDPTRGIVFPGGASYATSEASIPAGTEMAFPDSADGWVIEGVLNISGFTAQYGGVLASGNTTYAGASDLIFVSGPASAQSAAHRICAGGYSLNSSGSQLETAEVTTGTDYHFALEKYTVGGVRKICIYLDGVKQMEKNYTGGFWLNGNGVCILGRNKWDGSNGAFQGILRGFRTTKWARYNGANFTPEALPWPVRLPYIEGTVTDAAGAPAQRRIAVLSLATGKLVGSGTSDPSTGAYSVNCTESGEVIVVFIDDSQDGFARPHIVKRHIPD